MNTQWVIVGVIIFVMAIITAIEIINHIKLKAMIRSNWGKLPTTRLFDKEESLKNAWEKARKYRTYDSEIDDITWYDLDGFSLFRQINATYSSIGSEALYQRLRNFNFSMKDHERLEALIDYYEKHPDKREKIQYIFACLGKKDNNYVESYLTETREQRLPHAKFYFFCGLFPIVAAILALLFPATATILLALGSILFNVIYYLVKKEQLQRELACMSYFVQTVACGKKLSKIHTPFQIDLIKNLKPLTSMTSFGFSFRVKSNSEADLLLDYLAMVFMVPFISYHFVLEKLVHYEAQAKEMWRLMGELEVAAAILNFRKVMPDTCAPIFSDTIQVMGEEVYHPLLETPVANEVNWNNNTLVTGSNASGKSTYVKSIAINCILSATVHTALATRFELPFGHILTSMAVEDDIFEGDSYFVAEIKSVKRVLDLVETGVPCLCFIDEILKGTNTIERIAASSSMIQWLENYPSLAFVATHDIELTEILSSCTNVHFEEQVTKEHGVTFDYLLRQGPSVTRNAIKLLQVLNYPEKIVKQAGLEADYFTIHHSWK